MGHIQAQHTNELEELTHQTSNMLHTEGNVVNTSHPGCERDVAVDGGKSDPGRDDPRDYCSVLTFILKGERNATTWRRYKQKRTLETADENRQQAKQRLCIHGLI